MIIDTHQHFWQYNQKDFGWISSEMSSLRNDFMPDDIAKAMEKQQVAYSVAVQARQTEEETEFLLDLAQKHPQIAGVVGWIDLKSSSLEDRLTYFTKFKKLKGFRHIVEAEPDDRFLIREDIQRGIRALGNHHLPYDILIKPHQLEAAISLASRLDAQKFVIDHLAKPPIRNGEITKWSKKMRQFADMDHVYCKISGMVTEADWQHWSKSDFYPYLDLIFDVFGPKRVMLGSDWPVCTLAASYEDVWDIVRTYLEPFSSEEYQQISFKNAIEFYHLDVDLPKQPSASH